SGARGYNLVKPYSEKTAELMDKEVKAIVKDVHDRTRKLIDLHKDEFMQLGALLLEKEVIFAEDIERILGPKVKPEADDQFQTSPAE
ncbi:MAG TPA: cell division protein FtsH, partial [Lachnospiraceae bacterium]|nr:cell division protein FtsH [Lachnospiraceae bacterium]